jgi:hypothetical protein
MAMSRRTEMELNKGRELLWHFLEGEKCFFCNKGFLPTDIEPKFGNARAPIFDMDITIHHKNGNHDDNRKANRRVAHQSCHKSYHAKLVFKKWRAEVAA